MKWKVEVGCKSDLVDPIGLGIKGDIEDLGIYKVEKVKTSQIYLIEGDITENQVKEVGAKLLTDSVTQISKYYLEGERQKAEGGRRKAEDKIVGSQHAATNSGRRPAAVEAEADFVVEVMYKAGVTDAVGDSVKKGIKDLGIEGVKSVNTAQKYQLFGKLNTAEIELVCKRLLANEVIQQWSVVSGQWSV